MKILKRYFDFLNENFDLNSLFQKEHIPIEIQNIAKDKINKWFEDVNSVPKDVSKDKLILWYARNIYRVVYKYYSDLYNALYNDKNDEALLKSILDILNFLKGKDTNISDNDKKNLADKIADKKEIDIRYRLPESNIIDYIFSNIRNERIWKIDYSSTFEQMYLKSNEWHENLKASGSVTSEEGTILINYPDGFYWIDLETNDCSEEADAMGHCGRTRADTILSLRQKKKDGSIEPFITIAIDYATDEETERGGKSFGEVYQCKGKNNKKPVGKYHKYIVDLYIKYNIGNETGAEYMPSEDFELNDVEDENLLKRLLNESKLIDPTKFIFYSNPKFVPLFQEAGIDIIKDQYMVSNLYYLMKNDHISVEDFMKRFPEDFVLKDEELYLYYRKDSKNWKENSTLANLAFMYSNSGNRNEYSSREIIEALNEDDYYVRETKFGDLYLSTLEDKSIKIIEDKIEEIKKGLSEEELEEFEDYDDWEEQVKNIDSLSDLKDAIVFAFDDAQSSADEEEKYDECKKPLLRFMSMKELIYHEDGFLFTIDKNWLVRYDKYNSDYKFLSNKILESWFSEEGDNNEIEPEDELLKIDVPYYGWNGSIDAEYLHECIGERISEI